MLDAIIVKRLKRRENTYRFDKHLRKLLRLEDQLEAENRQLRVEIPYSTPILWKYRKTFVLTSEIQQSKDVNVWEMVLADVNTSVEAKTKKEVRDKNIFIRYLSSKIYHKLSWQYKQLFRKTIKRQHSLIEENNGSVHYKLMKPYFFTTKIDKIYHTHYVVIMVRCKKEGYISPDFMREKIRQEYYHEYQSELYEGGADFRRLLNRQYKAKVRQCMQKMKLEKSYEDVPLPRWRKSFKWLAI